MSGTPKILGIIPARKGSKRVPGKNTRMLAGRPLIEYSLRAASGSSLITSLVVSSDDPDVERITGFFPRVRFVSRPEALSSDTSPAIEYVRHVLEVMGGDWKVVVIVQPTTPFVQAGDIDATIRLLLDRGAKSSVSVVKLEQMHHPFKLKTLGPDGVLMPFLADEGNIKPAHELPDVYSRNGGVYASRIETIAKGLIIEDPCVGYVMPQERSVDINYPIDFEFAEFLAAKYNFNA